MTNDELLNKIMKDSLVMRHELVADENAVFERLAKISNALRVVVELHKPFMATSELKCSHCEDSGWSQPYPCATIQATEKELL